MLEAPLAVRAINHARREYLPTYLGLRLLFSGIPKVEANEWAHRYGKLSGITKRELPYHRYNLFKGFGEAGRIELRTCRAPAPTTLIAEIFALELMSRSDAFLVPSNVYSYRWPQPDSGYPYEFFTRGYEDKKRAVASALSESRDHVAVVTDIKSFYPSCDPNLLLERLQRRLSASQLSTDEKESVYWISRNLFDQNPNSGIPIGSALGHAFGHLALEDLDVELSRDFGAYYFRYVDDITVIAPSSQANRTREIIGAAIQRAGHTMQPQKTETIAADDWDEPNLNAGPGSSFIELRKKVTGFLALYPDKYEELNSAFAEIGVNLPLEQFKRVAEYGRFVSLFLRAKEEFLGSGVTVERLVQHAVKVRRDIAFTYTQELKRGEAASQGLKRKWHVQRLKWCLNRLMYLTDSKQLQALLETLPEYDELEPTRAVMVDLLAGSFSESTHYPGPTVNALAQLWRQFRRGQKGTLSIMGPFGVAQIDAVGALGIWGVAERPDYPATSQQETMFLDYCFSKSPAIREMNDLSYIDELRTLQIGVDSKGIEKILSTRFDDKELVLLDGLMIGAGNSS